MNSGTLSGFGRARLSKSADTAKVLRGDGAYVSNAGQLIDSNLTAPAATLGQDGDFARYAFASGTRAGPWLLSGPKAGGAWPSPSVVLPTLPSTAGASKYANLTGAGPCQPPSFVVECMYEAPTTATFTNVFGTWTDDATYFWTSAAGNFSRAYCMSITTSSDSVPPPAVGAAKVTVAALPASGDGAAAAAGCGLLGLGGAYGVLCWADRDGRFCLGFGSSLNSTGATGYVTATGTGVVVAGDIIGLVRNGSLVTASVYDGSTNAFRSGSQLQMVLPAASYDVTYGVGPGVVMSRTTNARLTQFTGIA